MPKFIKPPPRPFAFKVGQLVTLDKGAKPYKITHLFSLDTIARLNSGQDISVSRLFRYHGTQTL